MFFCCVSQLYSFKIIEGNTGDLLETSFVVDIFKITLKKFMTPE